MRIGPLADCRYVAVSPDGQWLATGNHETTGAQVWRVGDGNGLVPSRGFARKPPSYHIPRLEKAPLGYFYDVMTNGFGIMPDYAAQITPEDRWNIVAYIRALQLSQNATSADVPEGQKIPSEPPKFREPGSGATLPMLAPQQVVFLENVEAIEKLGEKNRDATLEALQAYLQNPAPFTALVLEAAGRSNQRRHDDLLRTQARLRGLRAQAEMLPKRACTQDRALRS